LGSRTPGSATNNAAEPIRSDSYTP
jgi:hypothetical protein